MSMHILEKNWSEIVNRVVNPLWKNKFCGMYESCKLDYDDFLSLAGYELTKGVASFDPNKSNIFTFATNLIARKASTELRNYGSRDKRRALTTATSLNVPVAEGEDTELIDTIMCSVGASESDGSDKRIGEYLQELSNRQLRILVLSLLNYDKQNIKSVLGISSAKLNDDIKYMSNGQTLRPLYRRERE